MPKSEPTRADRRVETSSPAPMGLGGWLVFGAFWIVGGLPLRWLHGIGAWIGRRRGGRARRIVERNLALCFPELDAEARQRLADVAMADAGRGMLEAFRVWTRPRDMLRRIVAIEGGEHLARARAQGSGVLVLAPHLGAWELLNLHLATGGPGGVLYRPPSSRALEAAIAHGRSALGMAQIRADRSAPRSLIRRVAAGELVGILPDQQPKVGEGVFAPFFGVQALTMTLAPRLSQRVPAVFGWAERLPDAGGFRLHFKPAPDALRDPDPVVATTAMNAAIEGWVRQRPAQYVWTYKRFTKRPAGEPARYGPETRRRRRR